MPWLVGGAAVGILVAGVSGYLAGRSDGRKLEAAEHQKISAAIQQTQVAMADAAAQAIAKIEVKHVTLRQQAETITREVPVYRDCRHTPDGLRATNVALEGGQPIEGVGPSIMPEESGAPGG